MDIKIVHNAKEANGIAIIIDVFRAFTVEPYIVSNNAKKLIIIGDKEAAYELKSNNPNYVLVGERGGIKLSGFDYGNSPAQIQKVDFTNKTVVHTTSCGTQGIVNAIHADEIITGSLVNLNAIIKYIKDNNFKVVSIVSLAHDDKEPAPEDQLCAEYIKALLENKSTDEFRERIDNLKNLSGKKFFDPEKQNDFPEMDYYLCTELDKFNFVLKVYKDENDYLCAQKILVE